MIGSQLAMAAKREAERSPVGGNLGWYLRREFRGGMTVEAYMADDRSETAGWWAAFRGIVRQLWPRKARETYAETHRRLSEGVPRDELVVGTLERIQDDVPRLSPRGLLIEPHAARVRGLERRVGVQDLEDQPTTPVPRPP